MPNEQREFWSAIAQKYDQVVDLQIGPKTRSMVRERLAREDRLGEVAEFGCGTGFYTEVLAAKADIVVATDLSPRMLAVAKERIRTANVTFQVENCQEPSLPDEAFDTIFISLVIHFTQPEKTVTEMRRILKPGGTLIIANLDLRALKGLDRIRCLVRILYYGFTGYRIRPPKGFGKNVISEKNLCDLLNRAGFGAISAERIRDPSRSSNIPVEYIKAVKVSANAAPGRVGKHLEGA
jgi:ABC-2 type transport system ATP-binding protein